MPQPASRHVLKPGWNGIDTRSAVYGRIVATRSSVDGSCRYCAETLLSEGRNSREDISRPAISRLRKMGDQPHDASVSGAAGGRSGDSYGDLTQAAKAAPVSFGVERPDRGLTAGKA